MILLLHTGYLWLIASLFFLFIELSTPGLFFFVAFAVGCVAASVAAFCSVPFAWQLVLSFGTGLLAFLYLKRKWANTDKDRYPTNIHALVGRRACVVQAIDANHPGRVKIGGEV